MAESLKLNDVFSRVAEAARQVLPFEIMGVSVVDDPEVPWEDLDNVTFSAYAVAGELRTDDIGQYRRSDVSPGLRLSEIGKVFRHSDVRTMLDASYLLDRRILGLDCRSLMTCLLPAARPRPGPAAGSPVLRREVRGHEAGGNEVSPARGP